MIIINTAMAFRNFVFIFHMNNFASKVKPIMTMSFSSLRIRHDMENLVVLLESVKFNEHMLNFCLRVDSGPYDGVYSFTIHFPSDYPFSSPRLICHTPIFHPNIDDKGHVCLKVLREGWLPSYSINSVVVSLLCALTTPSSEDALNTEAGDLMDTDYVEFLKCIKKYKDRTDMVG
ncbi:ubiquitin-conjugating enzyme E2 M [Pancytospora epiphaga]|nr:ubiquitin-conjugating enzyme E2 M [Pancytospora epiphaga]